MGGTSLASYSERDESEYSLADPGHYPSKEILEKAKHIFTRIYTTLFKILIKFMLIKFIYPPALVSKCSHLPVEQHILLTF